MSYKKPNTGNAMNDYFSRVRDFRRIFPNLLKARSVQSFEIWLGKLMLIDSRSLVLHLQKYQNQIPKEYWKRAEARLGRWLKDGDHK